MTSLTPTGTSPSNGNGNGNNTPRLIQTENELLKMISEEVALKVAILGRYYSQMGVTPEERASMFTNLYTHFKEHLDVLVTEAQDFIGALDLEIGNHCKDITTLAHALDDQDAITRMELIPTNIGLYPRSQLHSAILDSLLKRKEERLTAIESALAKIHNYYTQLSVAEEDRLVDPDPNDLSDGRIATLNAEVQRLFLAKQHSIRETMDMAAEITGICDELAVEPDELTLQVTELDPTNPDDPRNDIVSVPAFTELINRRDILKEERIKRQQAIEHYKELIQALWDRLGTDEQHRQEFLDAVNGKVTTTAVNRCKEKYQEILRTRAERMEQLIQQVRAEMQALYNQLKYTPEQRAQFAAAFSNVFDEACLEAHEAEKARLEAILSSSRALFKAIEKREQFRSDFREYEEEISSNAQNRYHERHAFKTLQRHERIQNRAKTFPEKEEQLRVKITEWETAYKQPFFVDGERYLEKMDREAAEDLEHAEAKRRMVQEQREQKQEERQSVYGNRPTGARAVVAPVSGGRTPRIPNTNGAAASTPRAAPAANITTPTRAAKPVSRNILREDNRREAQVRPAAVVISAGDKAESRNGPVINRTSPTNLPLPRRGKENTTGTL